MSCPVWAGHYMAIHSALHCIAGRCISLQYSQWAALAWDKFYGVVRIKGIHL